MGLVVFCVASILGAWAASGASAERIIPSSPLQVDINDQLGCQLFNNSASPVTTEFDTGSAEDEDDYCGTFFVQNGTGFGDPDANDEGLNAYDEISQTGGGTGTSADPYTITTVVQAIEPAVVGRTAAPALVADAGDPLATITEVETYVAGDDHYRTDITVHNDTDSAQSPVLYHAGDCALYGDDAGFAHDDTAQSGAVFCTPVQPPLDDERGPVEAKTTVPADGLNSGILGFVPIGNDSNYLEAAAGEGDGDLFDSIDGTSFDNTCAHCGLDPSENRAPDNGVGLSWALSLPPGGQQTRCFITVDSRDNSVPDVPTACSPPPANPPTINQQPPSSCALRISRARVFLFSRHPRLRLVARYRTDHPADVNIDFTAVKNGNKDSLGTVQRHFVKHGLFRLRKQLTDNEAERLRDTDKFTVDFEIPGEPGFCARQYKKVLSVPRIIDGQRVVFQSDSKFGPGSPGHPEGK